MTRWFNLAIIVVVAAIVAWNCRSLSIDYESRYKRIHKGMTFEDVEALLGQPQRSIELNWMPHAAQEEDWFWESRGLIWDDETIHICVGFDSGGRVVDKRFRRYLTPRRDREAEFTEK
jgi:hypothetical protein